MITTIVLFSSMAGCVLVHGIRINKSCPRVDTINRSVRDMYHDQPLFLNIGPKFEDSTMIDNICLTFFPLPDDPSTFQRYQATVYCDGSFEVESTIETDISQGVHIGANPFQTVTFSIFGYAGCDTYLTYACVNLGHQRSQIVGLSPNCAPIGLSCLRKIEEIISDQGLPDQEFYVLPMKLPNRCVTQQQCIAKDNNPFHKALGFSRPLLY